MGPNQHDNDDEQHLSELLCTRSVWYLCEWNQRGRFA